MSTPETAQQSAESPELKTASDPFNKPAANVILRSSDRVDFYVQRVILTEASPVFEDMFTFEAVQPDPADQGPDAQQYRDGIPIVKVTESSEVLDALLRFCYPIRDPKLDNAQVIYDEIGRAHV